MAFGRRLALLFSLCAVCVYGQAPQSQCITSDVSDMPINCLVESPPNLQTGIGFAFASPDCTLSGGPSFCIGSTGCRSCIIDTPAINATVSSAQARPVGCPECLLLALSRPGCNPLLSGTNAINAQQQVPPTNSSASGSARQFMNRVGLLNLMNFTISWSGLSTPITLAHIHRGFPGENGPIVFPIFDRSMGGRLFPGITSINIESGMLAGTVTGIWNLTASNATLSQVLAGDFYYNIHTERFPDGEIRGQVALSTNRTCLNA